MEKTSFINYPGAVAVSISEIIKTDAGFYLTAWNITGVLFILLLFFSVSLNFSISGFSKSRPGKIIGSSPAFLIFSGLALFILRLPTLALPEQNMDESQWIVNAATWLNGAVLWKDVNGFTSGPLLFAPLTIMYYLSDGLNYANIRLFGLLFTIIPSVVIIFLLFKKSFDHKIAALVTLPLVLFFSYSFSRDFISYESELIPMLLTCLCFYFFFSWKVKKNYYKIFLLGITLGLFPFAKLQAVPIAFSIFLCFSFELITAKEITSQKIIRHFLLLISAGIFPSLLLLFYLIKNNALTFFWNDYIIQNLYYAQSGLAYHISGFSKFLIPVIIAKETPEAAWFFGFMFMLILICSFVFFKNRNRISVSRKKETGYLLLVLVAAYFSVCMPGSYFYHYETLLIIPVLVFAGSLAANTFSFINEKPVFKKLFQASVILMTGTPMLLSLYFGNKGIDFVRSGGDFEISAVSKEISKYAIPNEKLAVWGWNNKIYVETELTQGTPGSNSFYETYTALNNNNEKLDAYINAIKKNQPVIFLDAALPVFAGFKIQNGLSHENFSALSQFISKNYTLVSIINQKKIYVLNEQLMKMGLL